jgi:hypothetical protein
MFVALTVDLVKPLFGIDGDLVGPDPHDRTILRMEASQKGLSASDPVDLPLRCEGSKPRSRYLTERVEPEPIDDRKDKQEGQTDDDCRHNIQCFYHIEL